MWTDLHCHILPGIDDGPQTLEESLHLARALAEQGFTHVVATPHYIEDYSPEYRNRINGSYTQLTLALREEKIPLTLYLGGELLVLPKLTQLAANKEIPTINGSRYVLLELPLFQQSPLYMEEVFFALKVQGYLPILAHPERVEVYKQNIQAIYQLVRQGVLLQVNLGSLAGLYGPSTRHLARELLKNNMAAFLATDSHDASLLTMVAAELKKAMFSSDLLSSHPQTALEDGEISINPRKPSGSLGKKVRSIFGPYR